MKALRNYSAVWLVDLEYRQPDGERPEPLCLVAREMLSGRLVRLWESELTDLGGLPFDPGQGTLLVSYYAPAELGCFLALGWELPARILDLYAEFKCLTAGLPVPCGNGLLGALAYHGLPAIDAADKDRMRDLVIRGGPYLDFERESILEYCQSDVDALARLLPAMLEGIDLPRALLRGRYTAAVARMEALGTPIDLEALGTLRENWPAIKARLVAAVDRDFDAFVPTGRHLDPESNIGRAILETATKWEIDPYQLADAVDHIWRTEREVNAEGLEARKAARELTGLTSRQMSLWEEEGKDHASVPGLDAKARELAGLYPALGIGPGYQDDAPDEDQTGRLWELLRTPDPKTRARTDPDLLQEAAEMVQCNPTSAYDRPMSFSAVKWEAWLTRTGTPWPRLETGALDLSDDTFREMARAYPAVATMRELRHALSQLRLNDLTVGGDGRNRCMLSPFASRTSRNQPSNAKYIFGPSAWARGLIRPEPGWAVAYVDWEQQEFGIAGALSGDRAMQEAYRSGDPYLTFAKQAGAVPSDGTKHTHKAERERFKVCSLAVQYGMSADSLARKLDAAPIVGRQLISLHRETYPAYWRWSDRVEMEAFGVGKLTSAFGWTVRVGVDANPRSLRNFPLQANGAEMLRLACILATERGIRVCAPVHDALLVEAAEDEIEAEVERTQDAMREASELVLPGFQLRTDAKIVRWPDRYMDPRGENFWRTVWSLVPVPPVEQFAGGPVPQVEQFCSTHGTPV